MENNTTDIKPNAAFKITYYSSKDKKLITRHGRWTSKSRHWTGRHGVQLMTYFDTGANNYRTAKGSWRVW